MKNTKLVIDPATLNGLSISDLINLYNLADEIIVNRLKKELTYYIGLYEKDHYDIQKRLLLENSLIHRVDLLNRFDENNTYKLQFYGSQKNKVSVNVKHKLNFILDNDEIGGVK
jgi:hypothetical protein